jgi:hypothetical protein
MAWMYGSEFVHHAENSEDYEAVNEDQAWDLAAAGQRYTGWRDED